MLIDFIVFRFAIVNRVTQEIHTLAVMYWTFVKHHLVDQEPDVITQEAPLNASVQLER